MTDSQYDENREENVYESEDGTASDDVDFLLKVSNEKAEIFRCV